MFLISGPSLLYVFKKWSEFTLKVVRVYLKSGPSLPGPNLPGPSLLVFLGPLLFIIYNLPIKSIFRKYPYIHCHLFAEIYTFILLFPFPVTPTLFNCIFLTASHNLLTGYPIIPYHLI